MVDGVGWWRNPLIPKARDRFDLESWPLELVFVTSESDRISGFAVSGKTFWWGRPDTAFDRVDTNAIDRAYD